MKNIKSFITMTITYIGVTIYMFAFGVSRCMGYLNSAFETAKMNDRAVCQFIDNGCYSPLAVQPWTDFCRWNTIKETIIMVSIIFVIWTVVWLVTTHLTSVKRNSK